MLGVGTDLADVEFGTLALICVTEAETLDALIQGGSLRVEEARRADASLGWGPWGPRGNQWSNIGWGVGVVHDEDGVLRHRILQ